MKENVYEDNNYGSLDQSTNSQNTDGECGFKENISILSNTLTSSSSNEEASSNSRYSSPNKSIDYGDEFEHVKQEKIDMVENNKIERVSTPLYSVKHKTKSSKSIGGFNHSTPVLRDMKCPVDEEELAEQNEHNNNSSLLLFNAALAQNHLIYNSNNLNDHLVRHYNSSSLNNVLEKISTYGKEKKAIVSPNLHQNHSINTQHKPITVCSVCGDRASGKHYGVLSCDGCRGFFKRSIRGNMEYVCKENNKCIIDVSRRNQCQACRLKRCLEVKMNKDAVQHQRPPRNQQIKRDFSAAASDSLATQSSMPLFQSNPNQFHHEVINSDQNDLCKSANTYHKSRFSPYHTTQSLKNFRQQNKFSNELVNTNYMSKHEPQTTTANHHENINYFNSSMNFPSTHFNGNDSTMAAMASVAAAAAASASFFPYQKTNFNPFKNISLNLSENSPSSFYESPLASHRNNVSTLSSGYCSLDENNSLNNPKAANITANYNDSKTSFSHSNSSASLAHIMNWIKNAPSTENLVDLTSRMLFSAIKWTKTQRNFLNLPMADQLLLLNENISELYILQMAENKSALNEIMSLAENEKDLEKKNLYENFQQILQKFHQDKVDPMEFYLLKSISLFKSNLNEIEAKSNIEKIQEECFISLFNYAKLNYPSCPRFGRLLILYTDLRKYTSKIVEEWLFQNLLGKKDMPNFLEDLIKVA